MTSKASSLPCILLSIALLITMLPLLGGAVPAAARGDSIKTVSAGDTIFVYETGLNLTALDGYGSLDSLTLVKYVDDDISKAMIKEIPVMDPADFDVMASQVGSDFGKYYVANGTGAFPGLYVQIAKSEATLGVVLSGSHSTSIDGQTVAPGTSIAFRIASPQVGTTYRTAAGVFEGQLAIEITTPSGTKVRELGGVSLTPVNVSRAEFFTDDGSVQPGFAPISLAGAAPGMYSARTMWITPGWKDRVNLDSNPVSFTIQAETVKPVATRGASIKDVRSGNTIFVYETGLDLTALDGAGGADPLTIVKFVDDNPAKAVIKEIPVPNPAAFDVLASQVGSDYGKYYAVDASGANSNQYVEIAMPETTLGVVLAGSHTTSVDGKSVSPETSIAFRIASPGVGTSYVTAAGVSEGQLAIEILTPGGAKVRQLGGITLSPINVSGSEQFTGAIPLKGVEPGTYSAVTTWITPDWKDRVSLNSNTVTFTVQSGSTPPATPMVNLSGKVTTSAGKGIPDIWVYFSRQDGAKSFYVKTGADGRYTAPVEKSDVTSQRYTIAANKDTGDASHPKNPLYVTGEIKNVIPSMNRANLNFMLASGLVTLSGKVTDSSGKPLADIPVSFTRVDGKNSFFTRTGADGRYSAQVERTGDRTRRYNLSANTDTGDASYPRNSQYASAVLAYVLTASDQNSLNFRLASTQVTLAGRVTNTSGAPLAGIWVHYARQDGQDTGFVQTNGAGYYTIQVARFPATDKNHRYTVAANRDTGDASHPKNPAYSTKELLNVSPDTNRLNLNFRLAPSR